ncbi:DUF736 domain-containing protein [Caulobacter endophyticus]|uniref:DUF736 domain-containing protein n=1 Tax=Caulobacter endophyticus TaxID=2172652 RepID=A0A2T9K9W8_9CAUL|nr:DUF736 domain-containing protein [Caulobacter endophyticus]PVM92772.1 DUF736 domain-containing protein [Caulobacter endophyticus]
MTTIGHFRREGDGFTGKIATLAIEAVVTLTPAEKFSAKAPDFIAYAGAGASARECGAAWRVNDASGAVLSLKLDDPTWPEPVSGRIMAAEDGALPLVWFRRADPPPATAPAPG